MRRISPVLRLCAAALLFGMVGTALAVNGHLRIPRYDAASLAAFAAYTLAAAIGMAVGFAEIASRYRDAPVTIAAGKAGSIYLLANGALAAGGLMLLDRYPDAFGVSTTDALFRATVAGTAAMLVMRSNLFRLKNGDGAEVAVGPALALDSLMAMVNREVDRARATRRLEMVVDRAMRLRAYDFTVSAQFISASMQAFQDLDPADRQRITDVLKSLETDLATLPTMIKYAAVGFELLTVAGDGMFAAVLDAVEDFHRRKAEPVAPAPPEA